MQRLTRWSVTTATLTLLFTAAAACLAAEGHGGHEEELQRTAQGVFYEGHRLPIDPTIKTFLAVVLMGMTIIGFSSIMVALGARDKDGKIARMALWTHRINGFAFAILAIFITQYCIRIIGVYRHLDEPAVVLHMATAIPIVLLPLMKIAITSRYRGWASLLPGMGLITLLLTWKEHRKRSGSVAKCDDPRVALGPAVLSESAALLQAKTKQKVSRQGVQSLWEPWRSASRRDGRSRGGRRTARAAEGKACRQFLAPFGDLDVPKGFAKNGDTIGSQAGRSSSTTLWDELSEQRSVRRREENPRDEAGSQDAPLQLTTAIIGKTMHAASALHAAFLDLRQETSVAIWLSYCGAAISPRDNLFNEEEMMEQEKDYFWVYIGGVILAVIVVLLMVKGSEHAKYETAAKAIAEDSANSAYKRSP